MTSEDCGPRQESQFSKSTLQEKDPGPVADFAVALLPADARRLVCNFSLDSGRRRSNVSAVANIVAARGEAAAGDQCLVFIENEQHRFRAPL